MKERKFDRMFYTYARTHLNCCPLCKTDSMPKGNINTSRSHVYRTSHKSVTMRCKSCGLKWTVTWRSLARSMDKTYEGHKAEKPMKAHSKTIRDYFELKKEKSPRIE